MLQKFDSILLFVVTGQVVVQGFVDERRHGPRRVIYQYARRSDEHQRRQRRLPGRPFRRGGKQLISRVSRFFVVAFSVPDSPFAPNHCPSLLNSEWEENGRDFIVLVLMPC